jgi:hypothetical protein
LPQGSCQITLVGRGANVQVDKTESVQFGVGCALEDGAEQRTRGAYLDGEREVGESREAQLEEKAVEARVVDEVEVGEAREGDEGSGVGDTSDGEGGEGMGYEGLQAEVFEVGVGTQESKEGRERGGRDVERAVDEAELAQTTK